MRFFTEKTLNWLFTILLITLVLYLISVFVADIVDRRVSGVRVSLPVNQRGGVASLAEIEGSPFVAPAIVPVATSSPQAIVVTPTANPITTYPAVPSAIPVPVVSPVVSTAPLPVAEKVIVGLPTPAMTTVPLSSVPAAAATAQLTVAPVNPAATAVAVTTQPVSIATPVTQPVQPVAVTQQPVALTTQPAPIAVTQPVQPVAVTTFYKDPREMTPEQLRKFKEQATFAKMTLQDYKNWLNLWRNDFVNLQRIYPAHVVNYQKFISGQPLVMSDLQLVVTSVALPVAVKTPGLDTAQGLYNRFFLGDEYSGAYPEVFAQYPNVTTIPLQIATTPLPVVIS